MFFNINFCTYQKRFSYRTISISVETGKIFPIFKGGTKSDPSNYRPISILPTISKIFKKHVNKYLMDYLNKHNLINKNLSRFRAKHCSKTVFLAVPWGCLRFVIVVLPDPTHLLFLITLKDKWMKCIDKGDKVGTLFLECRE